MHKYVFVALLSVAAVGTITACEAAPAAASSFKVGDKVAIEWKGTWWEGSILEVTPTGEYKVHYSNWKSSWDEVVPAARLKPSNGTAKRGSEPVE